MVSPRSIDDQPVRARLGRPDLARPAEDPAHGRAAAVARERLEFLRRRIESDHGVGAPVADPDLVLGVHVDGVGTWPVAGQLPGPPGLAPRIVTAQVAGSPLADPDAAARVRPHAPRALALRRRPADRGGAGLEGPARDVVSGE